MRVLVQRVTEASCTVDNKIISSIQGGYLLLVGFTHTDTIEDVKYVAKKIVNLRIFEDEKGKMNRSILDVKEEILSISQFTLYGSTKKGNRPSFTESLEPKKANELYLALTKELINTYHIPTKNGEFGAMMDISLINNGPVTLMIESK